jgi:hypothetical protein
VLEWTADVLFIKPLGKRRTNPITNRTTIARQTTVAIRVRLAINQEFRVACLDISLCVLGAFARDSGTRAATRFLYQRILASISGLNPGPLMDADGPLMEQPTVPVVDLAPGWQRGILPRYPRFLPLQKSSIITRPKK